MGERIVRYGVKKQSPSPIYAFGKVYKWSPKYLDYVFWFRTRNGKLLGERYTMALAEARAREISRNSVIKKTRAERRRAAFKSGRLVEEDRGSVPNMELDRAKGDNPGPKTKSPRLVAQLVQIMREREAYYRGQYGYFEVLPDKIHGERIWKDKEGWVLTEQAFKAQKMEATLPQEGYCTVDFHKETVKTDKDGKKRRVMKLAKRRIYKDGKRRQDIDYFHQDPSDCHLFPHVHIWIFPDTRLEAIEYLRHERTRYGKADFDDYYEFTWRFIIP